MYVCNVMYVGGGMAAAVGGDVAVVPGSSPAEDEVRLYNELEVIIHKVVRTLHTYIHTCLSQSYS